MGKFHTQITHRQDSLKAQSVNHTKHLYEPKSHGRTDQGIAVQDAKPIRVFDINRGAAILLLSTLASMVIRPVKAQPAEPTVGVINPDLPFYDPRQTIKQVPASTFCHIYRDVPIDPNTQTSIDARYVSITTAGAANGGFICGATQPHVLQRYFYGAVFVPSTGRFPLGLPGLYANNPYPPIGSNPIGIRVQDFATECQAVISWCGNN